MILIVLCLLSICPHIYCPWVQISLFTWFSIFCTHIYSHCVVWFNSTLWRSRKKCWPIMLMFCISCANFTQFLSHFLEITVMRGYSCTAKPPDNRRQLIHLDLSILWCVIIWKPHRKRFMKDIQLMDFDLHVSQTLTKENRAISCLCCNASQKSKSV